MRRIQTLTCVLAIALAACSTKTTTGDPAEPWNGIARGAYVLLSAGPDGIFFSRGDGPGTPADTDGDGAPNWVDDIVTNTNPDYNRPKVVEEYDDIRVFGGG